jgi:signal peptidase I
MKNDATAPAAGTEAAPAHSTAREWYESLLVAGIFVLFVRTFVVQTYQVPTGSMERTILVGDHLLVNKFAFAPRLPALAKLLPYRDVHPGDIVVFKKPGDDLNPGNVLVKRAVAQGGDTVQVKDKQLFVNGKAEERSTIQHIDPETYPDHPGIPDMARRRDQFGPFTVPANSFFGMGDNRDNSLDSRVPTSADGVGYIPAENLVGRAEFIFFSMNGGAEFWQLWRWPADIRWDRLFHSAQR